MMSVYTSNGYKYVVEFEKVLKKGVLNGLTVKDRLHFVNEKDARRWVRDVQAFDRNSLYTNFEVKAVA
jgi:hypothetical protein